MSKYLNIKTTIDGIKFDSLKEASRYNELLLLQRGGVIRDLELQPRYDLIVNGVKCGFYRGDFRYVDVASGETILEDCKSDARRGKRSVTKTPVYQLKKRLIKAIYNIDIVEV
jgi:Protein of unknown function (DUF1064)